MGRKQNFTSWVAVIGERTVASGCLVDIFSIVCDKQNHKKDWLIRKDDDWKMKL